MVSIRRFGALACALAAWCVITSSAHAALKQYQYQATNLHDNSPLPGAKFTIYNFGTTTRATIYDDAGVARSNPITADDNGVVSFKAQDTGSYQAVWSSSGYVSPLWSLTSNGAIPAIALGSFSVTSCGSLPTFAVGGTIPNPLLDVTLPYCNPAGGMSYRGLWNAAANSPTITSGACTAGYFYVVGTAGTTTINGVSTWNEFDQIVCSGTNWQRIAYPKFATEYATKAAFQTALGSMSNASAGQVARVRSVAAPGVGYGTCGLTYVAAASSTGIYGEVSGAGVYWQPQYSLTPAVETCEFGAVGDAAYSWTGATFLGTSTNSMTITVSSKTGLATGMVCTSLKWHSQEIAGLASAATLNSINPSVNQITLSATVPTGTNIPMACWNPMNSSTVTGTNAYGPIQAAIDYALTMKARSVHVAHGRYKFEQGLMDGYGRVFATMDILGDGPAYNELAGTQLICIDTTRPCISAQGLRTSKLKGMSMIGPNLGYALYAASYIDYAASNDNFVGLSADAYDWLDPSLHVDPSGTTPGGLRRYAPLVAVAVDPYSGSAPTAPYGSYTTPTALNGGSPPTSAYGRNLTSHFALEEMHILGFGVTFAAGLNTNSQGDFLSLVSSTTGYSPYGVYIGQQNGRNWFSRHHLVNAHHTVYSGTPTTTAGGVALGTDTGHWDGIFDATSGSVIYQVVDFNGIGNVGPMIFRQLYCEICARFGNFVGTGTSTASLRIEGGHFAPGENLHRRLPASFMSAGNWQEISIDGGFIIGGPYRRMWSLVSGGAPHVEIHDATFRGMFGYVGGSAALASATNYSGGILVGSPNFNTTNYRNAVFGKVLGTACTANGSSCGSSRVTSADHPFNGSTGGTYRDVMTQATTGFRDLHGRHWTFDLPNYLLIDIDTTVWVESGSGPNWSSCDTVTFNYIGARQAQKSTELRVGYALVDAFTQTIWVVTAVGSVNGSGNYPITAKQMNNMLLAADGESCKTATQPSLVGTYWIIVPTTTAIWRQVPYGTFTSGSINVTSVSRGDGYCGDLATYMANGDDLWGPGMGDATYQPWYIANSGRNSVSSFDTGACTLTLGANATQSGRFPITPYPVH
jgi:hypothetical protein